jgi:hypothetical protein
MLRLPVCPHGWRGNVQGFKIGLPAPQEMTLDEYEKILEERRANLNKVTPKKPYKVDEKEFKGLKIHTKKDVEEDVVLELTNKKAIGARKAGIVDKTLKEVCTLEPHLSCLFAYLLLPLLMPGLRLQLRVFEQQPAVGVVEGSALFNSAE